VHDQPITQVEDTETLPNAHVVKLIDAARQAGRQEAQAARAELARKLDVAEGAIKAFLADLDHADVPPEKRPAKLMELARELRQFRATEDVEADVREAIDAGDLDRADALLAERMTEQDAAKCLALERRADLGRLRLHYAQAAKWYADAAQLVHDDPRRRRDLQDKQASVLYDLGEEFGDNEALRRGIEVLRELLSGTIRSESALDWATTQNNLGNALKVLGERESGTCRFKQAVEAYRLALEEYEAAGAEYYVGVVSANLSRAEALLRKRRGE